MRAVVDIEGLDGARRGVWLLVPRGEEGGRGGLIVVFGSLPGGRELGAGGHPDLVQDALEEIIHLIVVFEGAGIEGTAVRVVAGRAGRGRALPLSVVVETGGLGLVEG